MKNKNIPIKLVTIGAGSSYTPELCEGLINRFEIMPIKEWVLVDIEQNKTKVKIIEKLVKRMFDAKNIKIKITVSYKLNKKELENANFVTTQLRVGLQQARKKDEEIAFKNGMLGQETNGIGGQFKAMRTIPVIKAIVEKVKKYCNGAWIINFTNPSGLVAEYVNKYLKYKKFIGVCNVPIHTRIAVSDMVGANYKDVSVDAAGLNHMIFFNKFFLRNKDITSEVLKKSTDYKHNKSLTLKNIATEAWNPNFIRLLNTLPCSYHKYYYKRGFMLKKGLKEYEKRGTRASQVIAIEKKLFEKYKDINLKVKPKELQERGGAYYSDVACGVINAIYNDTNEEFVVNVINDGKISNVPNNWTVEVTCKINKTGAHKVSRDIQLLDHVKPLVQTLKQYELLVAEAVDKKDINKALLAAWVNPLSEDDYKTEKAFYELMKAHNKYIKGWK